MKEIDNYRLNQIEVEHIYEALQIAIIDREKTLGPHTPAEIGEDYDLIKVRQQKKMFGIIANKFWQFINLSPAPQQEGESDGK